MLFKNNLRKLLMYKYFSDFIDAFDDILSTEKLSTLLLNNYESIKSNNIIMAYTFIKRQ